jgi:radical SAM protein with 4Fe4S-binding SPASM domain
MTRPVGYIDMALFESIIEQAADLGPSEIRLFNYGEPMLHPDLPRMIQVCRDNELTARFQTNGIKADPATIQQLLAAGMDYIGISVNGLSPEEYAMIRPGYRFEQVLENIRTIRKTAIDSGHPLHIHINAQILRSDLDERKADVEQFKRTWLHVADSLSISGLSLYDRIAFVNHGRVTESSLRELHRKPDEDVQCNEPYDRLIVKWDGRVTVCCADYDAKMVVGDLNHDPLAQVWTGPAITRIRQTIDRHSYEELPLCRTCPHFYSENFTLLFKRTTPAPQPATV